MKNLFWIIGLTLFISCTNDDNQVTQQQVQKEKYSLDVSLNPSSSGTLNISSGEYEEGTEVEIIVTPTSGFEFKDWTGDGSGNQNPFKLIMDSDKNIVGNLRQLEIESIEITNPIDTLVISRKHKFEVLGTYSNGTTIDLTSQVVLEVNDDKIILLDDNEFTVGKSGETSIKVKYDELELVEEIFINYFEEIEPHDFLKTPVSNSSIVVPVVIITYLPLKEGKYINQDTYPIKDYGDKIYDNLPVTEVHNWVLSNDIRTKYSIEEGSKYRNYKNSQSNPFVGIKVIKQYNFYEISKLPNPRQTVMTDGDEGWLPNYNDIFESIGLESLVNDHGVKEVWFNSKSLYIPESNMSSKLTGDISNSYRDPDDLPLYDNTYVVYGNFIHRWYGENIHNRGHQLESQLSFIEKDKTQGDELFWNHFIGRNSSLGESENRVLNGRCGDTHFPPNGRSDYDYDNSQNVISDIGDWTPDNSGEKKSVNNQDWKFSRQLPVNLPNFDLMEKYIDLTKINDVGNDPQGGWLIYWFQSIPGENNNIPYERNGNSYKLTNWWELFYNWDESIQNNKTLWE